MDKRFTDIQPLTCDKPEFGAEPPLAAILTQYYISSGIPAKKAADLALAYVKEWVRLEAEAAAAGQVNQAKP